jgi:hypothetical protein
MDLGIKKKIVFDLTCGLWDKGLWRPKEEYIKQWYHNIVEVPMANSDIVSVWYYGHEKYQSYEGKEVGKYLIDIAQLKKDQYYYLEKDKPMEISKNVKVVFLPFYNDNRDYNKLNTELAYLDPAKDKCRNSFLYTACKNLITSLIENQ